MFSKYERGRYVNGSINIIMIKYLLIVYGDWLYMVIKKKYRCVLF